MYFYKKEEKKKEQKTEMIKGENTLFRDWVNTGFRYPVWFGITTCRLSAHKG
jgi:hypothetical protein